jgi:hypothetical protein
MIYIIKKKINKKVKEFRANYKHIRYYDSKESVVLIDLPMRTKVRTYLNLIFRIKAFYDEPIVIEFSLFRYFLLAKWFKEIDYIYFSRPFSKKRVHKLFSSSKKADFTVNFNYRKVTKSSDYLPDFLPYIMHPSNYLKGKSGDLGKNIGIICSGNFEEKIYNTKTINHHFGMLNRWEIYQEIIKHSDLVQITGNELVNNLERLIYKNKFVLMKWQNGAIPTNLWRHYLSSADFIFCAPGMTMPLCHNVLEAMSVGVIPILNYEHWLNPSLENNKNCLVYDDVNEIEGVITMALQMSEVDKALMKARATEYYKNYYNFFDFGKMKTSE